ncbi:transcriptional regulator [Aminobacter sp. Y103A]|jgi:CheY-like chemotaxis protein|uniref:response regulator n=1 Tax=Aminobacter sp. Y103A TaxID=1870862 RepID=UPI0025735806|nr:response regulator [Aminobacter sp. SS-2016]WMC98107.1 response regulator [Aminobacter aminovorans]BBD36534.1 transcriptional regulator [Aminobacter sp. SS-2016]
MKWNDPDSGGSPDESARTLEGCVADLSKVLVVGRSPINRVVVAKIVERSGLKTVSEAPDTAAEMLHVLAPGTIILDGGSDNRDCDGLMQSILSLRLASGSNLPSVILLSNRAGTPESLSLSSAVDIVVAKPITPERLQPVVEKLLGRC